MGRYRAIYDEKGLAYEIENGEFTFVRSDLTADSVSSNSAPIVQADLPDFVSPIDGTVVRGRTGLRDHCARHNVVLTADLDGLPPKPMNGLRPQTKADVEDRKRTIAAIIDSRSEIRKQLGIN